MSLKGRRSHSNTVFKIAKTIGKGLYMRLKAHNDVFAKDSKQWRYFDYCWHLDLWSKEREQKDWQGENLSAIKHATLKWLVKTLAMVADWESKELFFMVLEISQCMSREADVFALELIEEATAAAHRMEYFDLECELRRLEREMLARVHGEDPGLNSMLLKSLDATEVARRLAGEVFNMEKIRVRYFEPITRIHRTEGRIDEALLKQLALSISQIRFDELETVSARRTLFVVSILVSTIQGDFSSAFQHGKRLLELYDQHQWLRQYNSDICFSHAKAVATLALENDDTDEAIRILERMQQYAVEGDSSSVSTEAYLIETYYNLGRLKLDSDFYRKGLHLFAIKGSLIEITCDPAYVSWLLFCMGRAAMRIREWKMAHGFFEKMLEFKAATRPYLLVHARLLHLLCTSSIETDQEAVNQLASTLSKLLTRSIGQSAIELLLCRSVGKIARLDLRDSESQKNAAGILESIKKALTSAEGSEAQLVFDYLDWFQEYTTIIKGHQSLK